MKKVLLLVLILLLCCGVKNLHAQDEKNKVPVFNYVIDDPMDAFNNNAKDSAVTIRYFLYPQFYSYWPVTYNDTVLRYICYDEHQNFVNMDTLHNLLNVQHISFIKSYTDYLQTFIDTTDGKPKTLSISKPLYQYDRTGNDTWKGYDYSSNFTSTIREYRNNIVHSDTTSVVDPATGRKDWTIRQYYHVVEIDDSIAVKSDTTIADPSDITKKQLLSFYYYSVPSFYFHVPKKIKDTTWEFLAYDYRDSLIPNVENFDSVKYYSLFKSYTDSAHTYVDANGQKQLLPVSSIIQRYDRQGKDGWMSVEYPGNKFTELKEFKSSIQYIDTEAIRDPHIDSTTMRIYKHYSVIKQ